MVEVSYCTLKKAAAIFTGIPILIFFLGWLNILAACVCSLLLCGAFFFSFRNMGAEDGERTKMQISRKSLLILWLTAVGWCVLAGQGSLLNQTSDHVIRNQIITDLTLKPWPVTYYEGKNLLCYYIAYWLLPCFLGKLVFLVSGSTYVALQISNIILLIQSSIGVFLTFLLIDLLTASKKGIF